MIRWLCLACIAAILGFATAAGPGAGHTARLAGSAPSAPHHRGHRSRCHGRRHHRHCAPPRHKPKPTKPTTPTGTTGTTTTPTTPTTPSGPLPSRLEVDENDQGQSPQPYSLWPSHNPVAAGTVQFNVYNFGQDPHTFAVVDSSGHQLAFARAPANQPETAVPVSVNLPPGTYTLECTLSGHANLGMVATLTVR